MIDILVFSSCRKRAAPIFDHERRPLSIPAGVWFPTSVFRGAERLLSDNQTAYPVLIFSHGYAQGFVAQNQVLMEELASHGYAVFSIGHPHESVAVVYPDDTVVPMSTEQIQKVGEELRTSAPAAFEKLQATSDKAQRAEIFRELIGGAPVLTASVRIWTADTRFVLDQLEAMNAGTVESSFTGKLDLSRVGVLGMSFGGTTAGQTCVEDPRVKAGVNLDGLQYGEVLERSLHKPFMFMNSEGGINDPVYERAEGPTYFVTVKDSQHLDFTDLGLISPLFQLTGATGAINGRRMSEIYNAYTLAFFDRYLEGKAAPLLQGPSTGYPEVEFQSHGVH